MKIKYSIGSVILFCISMQSEAGGIPPWSMIPLSSPTFSVSQTGSASITYQVTNESPKNHTLTLDQVPLGISQNTSPGNCPNPFFLKYKDSCNLVLDFDGSLIPKSVLGGPVLCQISPNGTPNANECYQPLQSNSLNITRTTPTQYSYVASGFLGTVYVCSLNPDGSYNTCNTTPSTNVPSWQPEAVAFATFSGTQYGYVTTWSDGIVYRCILNADGSFSSCNPTIPTGSYYTHAEGLSFTTVNNTQYAYVSDDVDSVFYCTLNSDGTFNTCQPTPSSNPPTWRPISLTFNTIAGTQYAYVCNADGSVFQCTLNSDGSFNTCNATPSSGAPSWTPYSLAFATVDGTQFAYVANTNGNLYVCNIHSDGDLYSCNLSPTSGFTVAVEGFNGTQYIYLGDASSNVEQCSINSDGSLGVCTITPSTGAPS